MKDPKKALRWIVNILRKHNIPFQAVGGLAARAHGAKRKLFDLDFFISRKGFKKILPDIKKYVVWGPGESKDYIVPNGLWDNYYVELNYGGQSIELSDGDYFKIFNRRKKQWISLKINYKNAVLINIYGLKVPVMPKRQLIFYKKILNRRVDHQDIKEMLK